MTNDQLNHVQELLSASAKLVDTGKDLERFLCDRSMTDEVRSVVKSAVSNIFETAGDLRDQARKVCENG